MIGHYKHCGDWGVLVEGEKRLAFLKRNSLSLNPVTLECQPSHWEWRLPLNLGSGQEQTYSAALRAARFRLQCIYKDSGRTLLEELRERMHRVDNVRVDTRGMVPRMYVRA